MCGDRESVETAFSAQFCYKPELLLKIKFINFFKVAHNVEKVELELYSLVLKNKLEVDRRPKCER